MGNVRWSQDSNALLMQLYGDMLNGGMPGAMPGAGQQQPPGGGTGAANPWMAQDQFGGGEMPPEIAQFLQQLTGGKNGEIDPKNPLANLSAQELLALLIDYFSNGMHQQNQQNASPPRNAGNMNSGGNFSSGQPASWGGGGGGSSGGGGGTTSTGGSGGTSGTGGSGGTSTSGTGGPRSTGETGIPDGLRENAANGAREVREMGFDGTIGGIGERSGPSDHPHGNAIDVMTMDDTKSGRDIAEHFRANHDELGVKYVIYEQMIASPSSNWEWRPMEDRGSPTANHMDHVHISFD
jgi:hypothetical protein